MFIFFILFPLLYLASNIYIYCKLLRAIKRRHIATKILSSLLFWAAAFSLFTSIAARDNENLPDVLSRIMFTGGSLWAIFIIFVALITALFDITRRIFPSFKCNIAHAAFFATVLLCYGNYCHRHPQVVPLDITLDKAMSGEMRIAVVSDLHLGHGTGKGRLKDIVRRVNKENPDLILIVGDLVDGSINPLIHNNLNEELSQLRAHAGIYMVPGNHEYIAGYKKCEKFIEETPIRLLCDTVVTLPNGVQLLLRDDYVNPNRMDIFSLYALADENKPTILLDHQPREIWIKNALGIDIQLSGHTHHGQVWPGNYITDHLFEQSHGYRKWSNSHVWVSSGVSLWGPPVRLGTRGDIAMITLKGRESTQDAHDDSPKSKEE